MTDGLTTIAIQELLNRIVAGDEAAKDLLITRAMERLTFIARRLLRSFGGEKRVELWSTEVVGEAYPRIARAINDVKPTSVPQFLGLARLQMHRVLLDKVRSLQKSSKDRKTGTGGSGGDDERKQDEEGTKGDEERQRMLVLDLLEAVEKLDEKHAETVWLKLAGYTHKEIGEFLGVHHDTVDDYWHTCCVKLAKALAPFMEHLKRK